MHTIQERTETSEPGETVQSARKSSRLLSFIKRPFSIQMRQILHRRLSNHNSDEVWALQMKQTQAGKVMNFKVIVRKETKANEVRYLELISEANAFLLKYFNFSCQICERLTSHIWTCSSCEQCRKLFFTKLEARGLCLGCCTQIQGCLSERQEELS